MGHGWWGEWLQGSVGEEEMKDYGHLGRRKGWKSVTLSNICVHWRILHRSHLTVRSATSGGSAVCFCAFISRSIFFHIILIKMRKNKSHLVLFLFSSEDFVISWTCINSCADICAELVYHRHRLHYWRRDKCTSSHAEYSQQQRRNTVQL